MADEGGYTREAAETVRVIRNRLRAIRKARLISQRELGDRCGIAESAICRIESGQRDLSLVEALALAEALGTSLPQLLDPFPIVVVPAVTV